MADLYKLHYAHRNGGEVEYYENYESLLVDLLEYQLEAEAHSRKPWFDRMLAHAFIDKRRKDERPVERVIAVYKRVDNEWAQLKFVYEAPRVWLEALDTPAQT